MIPTLVSRGMGKGLYLRRHRTTTRIHMIQSIKPRKRTRRMRIMMKRMRLITIITHSKCCMMAPHHLTTVLGAQVALNIFVVGFLMKTRCYHNRPRSRSLFLMSSYVSLER